MAKRRCECGKVAYKTSMHAAKAGIRYGGEWWWYQCRIAALGTFHLTRRRGPERREVSRALLMRLNPD